MDFEGQPFHHRGFTHAGVADQDGVVFPASGQDIRHQPYFRATGKNGIDFAGFGFCGEVRGILLQGAVGDPPLENAL